QLNSSSNRASYDTNTGHSYESQSPFWKRLVERPTPVSELKRSLFGVGALLTAPSSALVKAIALAREKATNK
ncbi:hypothetical protein L916_06665, partial [Phytophthora nicotianae]